MQRNGRIYQIGNRFIEINSDVLNMLRLWNANQRNDETLDFRFALTLLLSILSPMDILTGAFDGEAMIFLTGEYAR